MVSFILYSLFIVLMGCAGNVQLSTQHCKQTPYQWAIDDLEYNPDLIIKKRLWSHSTRKNQSEKFILKDILSSKKIKCDQVKNLRITWKQDWIDVLVSFLPFSQRQTLIIELNLVHGRRIKGHEGPSTTYSRMNSP